MAESHPLLRGSGSLYQRLAQGLRSALESGQYARGQRLPSTRQLQRELGLSLNTIHQALQLLEAEGWVEFRARAGTFARSPLPRALVEPAPPKLLQREDLVREVLRESNDADRIRLGATRPNQELLASPEIRRRVARLARQGCVDQYDFPWGSPALRQQIARLCLSAGLVVEPERILLTQGCQQAVVCLLQVLCQPGDVVAVESPTFFGYLEALQLLRLKVIEIPSSPEQGLSLLALSGCLQRHRPRCLLVTPNFSNPQGSLMSDFAKRQLMKLCEDADLAIIENDIQGELAFQERRPLALKAFDRHDRVYYCSSFSKTLGPENQLGWVVPGKQPGQVERALTFASFSSSLLWRTALADYLASGEYSRLIQRARRTYARQALQLYERLQDGLPPGSHCYLPQGGKMLWVELPAHWDTLDLYRRCREWGLSFSPGCLYSAQGNYSHCFRLNYSHWNERVRFGLDHLLGLLR
jgi:DNA-binding transcriptional MocR family regulator